MITVFGLFLECLDWLLFHFRFSSFSLSSIVQCGHGRVGYVHVFVRVLWFVISGSVSLE
jgi:hypothetical protein